MNPLICGLHPSQREEEFRVLDFFGIQTEKIEAITQN
jgi:hypothetical protein